MASDTMLNVRLDKTLKENGCQALECNGVTVSTLVRPLLSTSSKLRVCPPGCLTNNNLLASTDVSRCATWWAQAAKPQRDPRRHWQH